MKEDHNMSITAAPKRRYVKLPEDQWAEVEALWSAGSATLPELSRTFGVTQRTLQARFAKRSVEKGASAKALAIQVNARVQAAQGANVEDLAERAKIIRETTYAAAEKVERMIVASIDAAADDPSKTYVAAASVKMLTNAAAALERLHALKRSALGINDDTLMDDEAPTLHILNLTVSDVAKMRREQQAEGNLLAEEMGGDVIDGDVIDILPDDQADDDDITIERDDE